MSDVTRILGEIKAGDPQAAEQLLPMVYNEPRRPAARDLSGESFGQTLQPTTRVHEAYLRLDHAFFNFLRGIVSLTIMDRNTTSRGA